jgi:phosphatidylinositol kinase/protein kinase (PI-3  family)
MINRRGQLIHIDFGFILGISPGNMNFETAPFKLTSEMVDLYVALLSVLSLLVV